jgi:nitrate/TMAO reductase-like tetraheme cytochrome c subunit
MHELSDQIVMFIVLNVVLFMFLAITILIIIDHKVRIPGHFQHDPFSVSGLRRDHPVTSFFILSMLLIIITSLVFALAVTLIGNFDLSAKKAEPKILEEFKQQRAIEKKRQFHNQPVIDRVNLGKKPVCIYCHSDFPHSKQARIRTLLNMHTQFIGCLTCHNDPRKVSQDSLRFAWLNYSGIEVTGPHFGTDVEPESGFLIKTDDYYSKIVAYSEEGGENKLLEIPEINPEVQEFLAIRNQLTVSDRQAVKRMFHKNVVRKGRTCTRCHASEDKSYLPFRQLGFSQQRISDVTSPKFIDIVNKYSKRERKD